ncbi:MAG: HAD family hydrolase [Verrucomicrobia bacterium]|nr:HAD family hydrolase [Verrucomicrobiota bacterium]
MRPAFFFDRDGVVNRSPGAGYVLRWKDFHFNEGIIETLALLRSRGFALVLVTSQQGVGKGLMTQATLDEIHALMQGELARHGAAFDAIYACTCLADDAHCTCRKPSPEMILRAAAEHDLDLTKSWLVGDHDRDIQMAHHAGVPHTIRIRGDEPLQVTADRVLDNVRDLLPFIMSFKNSGINLDASSKAKTRRP